MRVKITLECTECKQRNYDTTKEKRESSGSVWKRRSIADSVEDTHYTKRRNNRFPREWKGMRLNDGKF